jgi:enoyl-CoA hydratase
VQSGCIEVNVNFKRLTLRHDEELLWITLNRPEVLNAFDLTMWREVREAVHMAERDPAIRVVSLIGAGRGFSAGYDLIAAMEALTTATGMASPNAWRAYAQTGNDTCWTVWESKKPVIAAVHGYCLGGAFELTMACDFVISSDDAMFGEPEIRLSDAPPFLISPWVMGMRQAKYLLLTGDLITAGRALEFGILNEVCTRQELEERVRRLARKLAGFAFETWHLNKKAVNRCYEIMGLRAAVDMGTKMFATTNVTPNELKAKFVEYLNKEGFSAAIKWVQSRYEKDKSS